MKTRPHSVGEYVRELERALSDFPPERRNEIVSEIEDHIEGLLAELGATPTEAEVRNVLERVGDPDEIAAEARDARGAPGALERAAPRTVVVERRRRRGWIVALVVLFILLVVLPYLAMQTLTGEDGGGLRPAPAELGLSAAEGFRLSGTARAPSS